MSSQVPTEPAGRGPLSLRAEAASFGLSEPEFDLVVESLGREPNALEAAVYGALWSEHCGYKNSRPLLRLLPTEGANVLQGPGENAGVVDIGGGLGVAFKMESHNHPSAVEPVQGAATGVGGILRDIFAMGARPFAVLDSLRFGELTSARSRHLLSGVVAGISSYGNAVGVPTVGGEVEVNACFEENPLVNVMALGLLRHEDLQRGTVGEVGNRLLYVGSRTGRDGLGGGVFASADLSLASEADRPAVQVGDPFMEKLLLEACLEAFSSDLVAGVQDMGAAGLASSVAEMAHRAQRGVDLDLDAVPRREHGMTPLEVMLSESQERMMLTARPGLEDELLALFERYGLEASWVGVVRDHGELRLLEGGELVAAMPVAALNQPPEYVREGREDEAVVSARGTRLAGLPAVSSPNDALLTLLAAPAIASKEPIFRRFDHQVMTNTVVLPGAADAAVLREQRRGRRRRLALRSGAGLAVLAVLVLLAAWWLLGSLGGRDFLLSQVVARLPAGTTLEWRAAEGPASGPLTLHDVVFQQLVCPEVDDQPVPFGQCASPNALRFSARRITLDPAIRPLFGRLLRLDAAQVEGALLELPPSSDGEPFSLPRWPEVLPQVEPPLGLQADHIEIDGFRVLRGGEPMIDIASVRGGLQARRGELQLRDMFVHSDRGLFLAHGDYAPGDDYRMDLTASALLPAPAGTTRPRLGLVARGDVSALEVALSGHAPAPVRLRLSLRGAGEPEWIFAAASEGLDPALLAGAGEPGTPMAFELSADGRGGRARLQGDLAYGELSARIQPSVVVLDEQVLEFDPLVVDAFDGRVTVTGRGDFGGPGAATGLRYAVVARGLAWAPPADDGEPAAPAAVIRADADIGLAGTIDTWAVVGNAGVARDGQRADVELRGLGNRDRIELRSLAARTPGGRLDGTGHLAWAPVLGWDIDVQMSAFDPGYFAPGFEGAIDGRITGSGQAREDGGMDLALEVDALGGQLRGRRVSGRASFAMQGAARDDTGPASYEGDAALAIGGSRIDARGRVDARVDIEASFAPLRLSDLLPGADGSLEGELVVSGGRGSPDIRADLAGRGLRYAGHGVDGLRLDGRLPWRGGTGTLEVEARGVQAGGIAMDTLRMDARGAVEDLRLDASGSGEIGSAALAGTARRATNGLWRGSLESLQVSPALGAAWRLESAAVFRQAAAGSWTLDPACLASDVGGRLCASADWPRQGLAIDGQGLPLALALPYLPQQASGRPWVLDGELDLDARLRPAGNAWQGHFNVDSDRGALRTSPRSRRDVLSYSGLTLEAVFDANRIDANLGLDFNGEGRIAGRVRTGWDAYAPLEGQLTAATSELTWVELFSPDIVSPTGRLDADIAISGTRAAPLLGGHAALEGLAAEIPALAIAIVDGRARLDARPDGSARITGNLGTGGEGRLAIDGSLDWRAAGAPLQLQVSGRDVLVSDTRDLRAVASPDIEVRYAAGRPLRVSGRVHVPSARMDLERLSDGVSASPDVVVLDPVDPEEGPPMALELDLALAMGSDVLLSGFGLQGALTGELRVLSRAGREMTGQGMLEVGGRYEAYGQELDVTRGRLLWSNTPVSDPVLDIRAERRIDSVTAGIDVSGRASAPRARVWTDPASDESEALAYLALGRPLSSLSGRQASDLDAASAALNAGGSLLAGQLGKQIGLDDAGVMQSRALGGSVLGIGKQLSPRLYVGFGVSLLGTGQVLTLKYLLRKGFDVEVETSTRESRGSVNYRHER